MCVGVCVAEGGFQGRGSQGWIDKATCHAPNAPPTPMSHFRNVILLRARSQSDIQCLGRGGRSLCPMRRGQLTQSPLREKASPDFPGHKTKHGCQGCGTNGGAAGGAISPGIRREANLGHLSGWPTLLHGRSGVFLDLTESHHSYPMAFQTESSGKMAIRGVVEDGFTAIPS